MSRDVLIVSTANVECERIFNIIEALYDHRKSYNSIIFFALMMIRFHDQKKNSQTRLNADLAVEEKLIIEDLNKKMKKRVSELQIVYNKHYINDDDDESDIFQNTSIQRSIAICWLIYFIFYTSISNLILYREKINEALMLKNSFLRNKTDQAKESLNHETRQKIIFSTWFWWSLW